MHANRSSRRVKKGKAKAMDMEKDENAYEEGDFEPLKFMKDEEIPNLMLEIQERWGVNKRRTRAFDPKIEVVEDDRGGMARRTKSQKALMAKEYKKKSASKKGKRVFNKKNEEAKNSYNLSLPRISK